MARGNMTSTRSNINREHLTEQLFAELTSTDDLARKAELTEELVSLHLGLCDALAGRYLHRGADREDLVQVARVALVLAIKRFQPGAGRTFVAYAAPTISGELKRYFRDHCWMVRPPRRIQELRARASRERADLEQHLGRKASVQELSDAVGAEPVLLEECAAAESSYRPWSLEARLDGDTDGGSTLGASLADPAEQFERATDRLALQRALAGLSRRDRSILLWRFEEGCTQEEIGRRLGISQMQVSRLIRRILSQARQALGEDLLTA
ncbi:MAG: sigma-70 family RNA polymerase sigma factor [Propionibacteriaceae bacterium]|nr:sigma-70 family RNA polymerase sigma factor [Propionibacteriaceae bacterium]